MRFILAPLLFGLLIFGIISPAWASTDLSAYIPINGDPTTPDLSFSKIIYLDYPNGGKLKDALAGKNLDISFTADSANNTSVKNMITSINSAIQSQGSSATVTDLTLDFSAKISGNSDKASITYLIKMRPTVTNYLLYKGTATNKAGLQGGGTPYILDAAWAAFNLNQPATISTSNYKDLEINYPINLIQKELPDVYSVIKGTAAEKMLQKNVIDASALYSQQPLNKWDHLFDPSYVVSDAASLQFKGAKVPVTTFETGTSNLQSGSMSTNQQEADFTSDVKYHISIVEPSSSGTFNVEGQAQAYNVKGAPAFTSTIQSAGGVSNTTAGGMSTMILYGMAGGAGGVAVFIFFWSNKRFKADKNRKPEAPWGPIQYEERKHWADKFDDKSAV